MRPTTFSGSIVEYPSMLEQPIMIACGGASPLSGLMAIPLRAKHLVIVVHGRAKCCHNLANHSLTHYLNQLGVATLLVDLMSEAEQAVARRSMMHYDRMTLAMRLIAVTEWVQAQPLLQHLSVNYVSLFEGGAIAVQAAIERPALVQSIMLPGGHLESVQFAWSALQSPTLLMSGESDVVNILAGQRLLPLLPMMSELVVVARSPQLIGQPGLHQASQLIAVWLEKLSQSAASRHVTQIERIPA
jgi:putative phosphoribosyl transferase